jgi:endo-1,4-beta-xylanase
VLTKLSNRTINFNGTFRAEPSQGGSFLSVYGWFLNPRVQYYIIENWVAPYDLAEVGPIAGPGSQSRRVGQYNCDGATYSLGVTQGLSFSIEARYQTYWSVRNINLRRSEGTVNTTCHLEAYRRYGLAIPASHQWQIVATEGYWSNGFSTMTVAQV